jgi:DNA (cytosine-5)-methyltransferase 1
MPYLFDDLKVSSYFSGIGAFEKALDRLFEDIDNAKTGGDRNLIA